MIDDERFDDEVLDSVLARAEELAALPPAERADEVRATVRHVLALRRPDGTWPDAVLVHELLAALLDLVGDAVEPDRFLDAWREAAADPSTLERMLAALRADIEAADPGPIVSPVADAWPLHVTDGTEPDP